MADSTSAAAPAPAPRPAASGPANPDPTATVPGAAAQDAIAQDATSPDAVAPAPVATPAVPQLHATKLSTLLESGKYSDLTLHCGSRKWKVHKSVLCIQSEFFAKACDGEFKEAQTNTIDLSEDHEHAVAAMVHFMYHGSYDITTILPWPEHDIRKMQLHVRVVGLAQKYFIEPLSVYAKARAMDAMKDWDGSPSIFASAVHEVYTGTVDTDAGTELRQHAVSVAIDNATRLFSVDPNEEGLRTREILIDGTPGFIGDWATGASERNSTQASTIVDLTSVNDTLNADNVKLNANVEQLEKRREVFKGQMRTLVQDMEVLRVQLKNVPFRRPHEPKRPQGNQDPAPQYYLCPNCDAYFVRSIPAARGFQHICYDNHWTGQLGKSGVNMSRDEWQKHLVPHD